MIPEASVLALARLLKPAGQDGRLVTRVGSDLLGILTTVLGILTAMNRSMKFEARHQWLACGARIGP